MVNHLNSSFNTHDDSDIDTGSQSCFETHYQDLKRRRNQFQKHYSCQISHPLKSEACRLRIRDTYKARCYVDSLLSLWSQLPLFQGDVRQPKHIWCTLKFRLNQESWRHLFFFSSTVVVELGITYFNVPRTTCSSKRSSMANLLYRLSTYPVQRLQEL